MFHYLGKFTLAGFTSSLLFALLIILLGVFVNQEIWSKYCKIPAVSVHVRIRFHTQIPENFLCDINCLRCLNQMVILNQPWKVNIMKQNIIEALETKCCLENKWTFITFRSFIKELQMLNTSENQTTSHCGKMELVAFSQNCSNLPHRISQSRGCSGQAKTKISVNNFSV